MKREAGMLSLLVALPVALWGVVPAGAAPRVTKITKCPFVITEPGSYLVQKNLSCVGTAITVSADHVDLDLGGHTIAGSSQSQGGVAGIYVQGRSNVIVRNGVVQGFWNGVDFERTVGCKITGVTASQNGCVGIVGGDRTSGLLVTGCTATQNLCNGISFYGETRDSTVTGNAANGNRGWGISIEAGSFRNSVTGNTANQNGDRGITLYASGNHVEGNTCDRNGGGGIDVAGDSHDNTVVGNFATANGDGGIRLFDGPYRNTIERNKVSGNFHGISLGGGANSNIIQNNTANLNILGIRVFGGTCCNTIQSNTALTNRDWDLADDNPGCANSWFGNTFQTRNQDCIN